MLDTAGRVIEAVQPPEGAVADPVADAAVVRDVLAQLDEDLVGLAPVKTRIKEIAATLAIEKLRRAEGLTAQRPTLHMSFTGNPGTGKTTVALRMADILHRLGYLERGHLVTVTRDDLVGQYVGHTAPKTKEQLRRAYGGVLFIDEAYYLHRPGNDRDYGSEAIEMLLQAMENDRDKLVVVFAGYQDRMQRFFQSNPGMSSRVAHHIHFPDYTEDELMEIAGRILRSQDYSLGQGGEDALREYIRRRLDRPDFAHGRSIRNAIERARMRQACRLFERDGRPTRAQLETIEPEDIRRSSIFDEPLDTAEATAAQEVPCPAP